MGWFGSLGLAWKYLCVRSSNHSCVVANGTYSLVFACLLVLTIVAGLIKVLYNRKQ